MRYKNLTKEQLIISFDRLTRFKPTKEKYFRVFADIILSNLIEPVYKKQDLVQMTPKKITELAEEIINSSLKESVLTTNNVILKSENRITNDILKEYENSVFKNDNETQDFLNNNINYQLFFSLINESCPINLRWLKALLNINPNEYSIDYLRAMRAEKGYKYPIEKVLLVEGITEEILLPAFSNYLGFDFYKEGIQILPAGGKNQVVKMYYRLIEVLKIPIYILLDKDAEENIRQINPKLRNIDKIHLVSCGEFEDLLPKSLIIKTVNNELSNFAAITDEDLDNSVPEAKNLENIFKTKGLHEFKKADFAKLVKDNISEDTDISDEIASIINEIK